jgi:hypothetical protein
LDDFLTRVQAFLWGILNLWGSFMGVDFPKVFVEKCKISKNL